MCLIVFAWRADARRHLLLAGNRDELHARPSRAAGFWTDAPAVLAGRDLKGGGTWLGVTRDGRFAAVTNVRAPLAQRATARSRGELTASFLAGGASPEDYARSVFALRAAYNPFNLVIGDRAACWFVGSGEEAPRALAPGVYGLSNATLDSPWPKVLRAKARLTAALESAAPVDAALDLLADRTGAPDEELPDTGVGIEWERALAPAFIAGEAYGTRASTCLSIGADGIVFVERSFGPLGVASGEGRYAL
jgi:uncharacterized protein with NRDE domain